MKTSFVVPLALGIMLPLVGLSLVVRAQEPPVASVDPKLEAEKAAAVKAIQNVKSLTTACMMNATDFGKYKIRAAMFKTDVGPYVKDTSVFTSPLDKPGTASYKFNKALQNVPLDKVRKPSETVVIYEGEWGDPAFRHHGMAVLGFADGHVKLFRPETAKRLLWKP